MLVVFHERERSSFTFHINQKVEEGFSFQPKVNDTKVSLVTSTFYFSTIYLFPLFSVPQYICFHFSFSTIYFFSLFSVPQYICFHFSFPAIYLFHFSFSTIYLFPLFSVPRARSVPQPPRSCCCGKWWRWQVPVYHCFFATILFCIKPMVMTGD